MSALSISLYHCTGGSNAVETENIQIGGGHNPSTGELEAGLIVSSRPTWATQQVPGYIGYETLSQKNKNQKTQKASRL
jgi:hypothetical protein